MINEFSTLLEDVKEQILYLQELGVENFNVELPEIEVQSSKFKVQSLKSEIPRERLEKFVPADDILKSVAKFETKNDVEKPRTSRLGLLEQTKLSNLGDIPKRNSYNFSNNKTQEQAREENQMAKKQVEEMPTLFGGDELKQTLPESTETMEEIRADIGDCTRCPLHEGRTQIVHSTGNREADLMFVGEAPGADEDAQGKPFVGRSGQLLTKIIESIGLKREDVFIGNINRCRPPGNRTPTLPEAETCKPFLIREIAIVRPKVIVVMGNTAMKNLLETKEGITKLRGEFIDYYGVKVMPTFHPAYLLRDPRKKREVWEDMKKVRDEINKLKS
jgi:DNA polymerase